MSAKFKRLFQILQGLLKVFNSVGGSTLIDLESVRDLEAQSNHSELSLALDL